MAAPRPDDAPGAPDPGADPLPAGAAGSAAGRVALGRERVVVERAGHRRADRARYGEVPDHQLPDLRGAGGAPARPAQQARAVDADRPRPHGRRQRLADPPGAGADHRPDRHRYVFQGRRRRAGPRRRPRARGGRAAQRPAAPVRLARGARDRPGSRTTRGWSPASSRGGSGTPLSPPPGWSSPRPSSARGASSWTRSASGTTCSWTRPPRRPAGGPCWWSCPCWRSWRSWWRR